MIQIYDIVSKLDKNIDWPQKYNNNCSDQFKNTLDQDNTIKSQDAGDWHQVKNESKTIEEDENKTIIK